MRIVELIGAYDPTLAKAVEERFSTLVELSIVHPEGLAGAIISELPGLARAIASELLTTRKEEAAVFIEKHGCPLDFCAKSKYSYIEGFEEGYVEGWDDVVEDIINDGGIPEDVRNYIRNKYSMR